MNIRTFVATPKEDHGFCGTEYTNDAFHFFARLPAFIKIVEFKHTSLRLATLRLNNIFHPGPSFFT